MDGHQEKKQYNITSQEVQKKEKCKWSSQISITAYATADVTHAGNDCLKLFQFSPEHQTK